MTRLFVWLKNRLGIFGLIDKANYISDYQFHEMRVMLDQIQDTLNAMQKDKLKVYVHEQKDKPKYVAVDFEASQQQTLKEFEGE